MTENIALKTIKYLFKELMLDILYFPIWWYTKGVKKAAYFFVNEALAWSNRLSLRILFKNLFKPMYGDYTRSGKIISFFIRLAVLFFKMIAMVVWLSALIVMFLLWIVIPPFIAYMIFLNITGQSVFFK